MVHKEYSRKLTTVLNMLLHRLQFGHKHSPLLRSSPVTSVGALPRIGEVEPVDLQWQVMADQYAPHLMTVWMIYKSI